jgi:hypothetical protein
MLLIASIVKLIAEIALLALLGQGVLGLLVGAQKENNLVYQLLQLLGRPFVRLARLLTPRLVLERHLPLAAFLLLVFVWLVATLFRISRCLEIGVALCR